MLRDPFVSRGRDGCPDVAIEYAQGDDKPKSDPSATLTDVARELQRIPALEDLAIVAVAAPGEDRPLLDLRITAIARASTSAASHVHISQSSMATDTSSSSRTRVATARARRGIACGRGPS